MGLEKFKRFKDGIKKVAKKAGNFFQKAAKVVEKFQPAVDLIGDVVPYGNYIKEAVRIGTNVAEKGGRALESIGEGKNVREVIKDTFTDDDRERISGTVNKFIDKQPEERRQKIRTAIDTGKKVVKTAEEIYDNLKNNPYPKPPILQRDKRPTNIPEIAKKKTFEPKPAQFIQKKPYVEDSSVKPTPSKSNWQNNILNNNN